jgi:hypothetical protein
MDVPIFSNALDWQHIAGEVFHYTQRLSNCTILVDVGGQGIQFAKMLENLGCPNVVKINWGNPSFVLVISSSDLLSCSVFSSFLSRCAFASICMMTREYSILRSKDAV